MTHIQQRRGTAAEWTSVNPVLFEGEAGHETDTGRWKLGDGVTAWSGLPYKAGVDSVAGKTGIVTLDVADVAGAAPLASPILTGNPTAPTPATSDNDTTVATTAFVKAVVDALVETTLGDDPDFAATVAAALAAKAPLASPVFTGDPTAPTPAVGDNDTSVATTKYVRDVLAETPLQYQSAVLGPSGNFNNTAQAKWGTANYSFTSTRDGWATISGEFDLQTNATGYGLARVHLKANGVDIDSTVAMYDVGALGGSHRVPLRFTARVPVRVTAGVAMPLALDVSCFSSSGSWKINTLQWLVTVMN